MDLEDLPTFEKFSRKTKSPVAREKLRREAQQCLSKKGYSREKALKAQSKCEKRGMILRAYNCPHCYKWHLTSKALRIN